MTVTESQLSGSPYSPARVVGQARAVSERAADTPARVHPHGSDNGEDYGGHGHAHGDRAGHGHDHGAHGHDHGGVDATILRSREAMRTLALSLAILGATAAFQVVVVVLSGSARCWPTRCTTSATR